LRSNKNNLHTQHELQEIVRHAVLAVSVQLLHLSIILSPGVWEWKMGITNTWSDMG